MNGSTSKWTYPGIIEMVDHFTDQFIIQSPVFIPKENPKESGDIPPHVIADMSYWIYLILGPLMFKCRTSMKKKLKKHEDIDISEHGLTSAAVCISLELLNVKLHSSLVYS